MRSPSLLLGLVAASALSAAGTRAALRLVTRGELTLDLGIGRSTRPLGPLSVRVEAPRETVFEVIAEPYLERTPRALAAKLQVLERGSDMALAAHFTELPGGGIATTVETVRFERPATVSFRLLRGPVPHVLETFHIRESDGATDLLYTGEMGTDLWGLGRAWGDRVAPLWEQTVARSLRSIQVEAERRARLQAAREGARG
jgi:hypothetical protein